VLASAAVDRDRLRRLGSTLSANPWWLVGALTVIGAYLRLVNLGALAFHWDEDLYSLAAKAILERGIPELPSGMVYLRGGAFLYLTAASIDLLGFSESALRLPAALFGIATIPLGFLFAARLFGNTVCSSRVS
jgi:predicted membrane-bound mannosyltransferase